MLQALAFVKSEDVIEWFDLIQKKIRVVPRFPISTWNLYDRIMNRQPRTTNAVEAWHNALTSDEKKHLKIKELLEK
ncbi:hypothetical protein BpHYR1_049115 [Brachionus plicatilis]|uniref:Uncharacterized protein n=1 Tax=Brachionus plicatilis TaxID=10195 RepID=A0A3M7QIV3_BRAPC|nr:hypothetical protein BpHYR1_049115 [Brachionus plicatilis]